MKRLLLLLLALSAPVFAENVRYQVRPVYSNIRFSIVKWGVLKEEGVFRDFAGTLDYDPAHPEKARIDVLVQTASLDTKNEDRDKVVRSPDFLDAGRHPTLEFHSSGIERNVVSGELTIHGITKRVQFPVCARLARPAEYREAGRIRDLLHHQPPGIRSSRQPMGCGAGRDG